MADFFNGLIGALMTGGESAAEAYVLAMDPALLTIPPIKWLIDEGIHYIGGFITAFLARGATGLVIDIQTNGQNSSAVIAATALQYAIASGKQDAIKKATEEAAKAYGNLIHWGGVAHIP